MHQLAEHLVAEIEAIAHLEMKTGKGEKTEVKPVLKKFEEWKGGEKGGNRGGGGQERTPITCRFFISDADARRESNASLDTSWMTRRGAGIVDRPSTMLRSVTGQERLASKELGKGEGKI